MKLKKILSIMLALACILSLVACGDISEDLIIDEDYTYTTRTTTVPTTTKRNTSTAVTTNGSSSSSTTAGAGSSTTTTTTTTTTATTTAKPNPTGKTVNGKSVFNNIDYTLYIPSTYKDGTDMPLVMALHGGGQGTLMTSDRTLFANFTGLNTYAEQYGFIVVYPRQSTTNHFFGFDYWNWYNQRERNNAEPKALYDILCEVKSSYSIDDSNVFVCGFSAGAAMAANMAVTYPEVFAGCCMLAGLSYKACETNNATIVQTMGTTLTTQELANRITTGMGSNKKVGKMLIVTGTTDVMVNPSNSTSAADAWATAMKSINSSLNTTKTTKTSVGINNVEYTKSVYAKLGGEEICTLYEIKGMSHQWPGAVSGVSVVPSFGGDLAFNGGINLSKVMCEFFGLDK